MITIDRSTTVIDQLPSIGLDELVASAGLQTRLDCKYLIASARQRERRQICMEKRMLPCMHGGDSDQGCAGRDA